MPAAIRCAGDRPVRPERVPSSTPPPAAPLARETLALCDFRDPNETEGRAGIIGPARRVAGRRPGRRRRRSSRRAVGAAVDPRLGRERAAPLPRRGALSEHVPALTAPAPVVETTGAGTPSTAPSPPRSPTGLDPVAAVGASACAAAGLSVRARPGRPPRRCRHARRSLALLEPRPGLKAQRNRSRDTAETAIAAWAEASRDSAWIFFLEFKTFHCRKGSRSRSPTAPGRAGPREGPAPARILGWRRLDARRQARKGRTG